MIDCYYKRPSVVFEELPGIHSIEKEIAHQIAQCASQVPAAVPDRDRDLLARHDHRQCSFVASIQEVRPFRKILMSIIGVRGSNVCLEDRQSLKSPEPRREHHHALNPGRRTCLPRS